MTSGRQHISEEAALWVQRLEHEDSPARRTELDRWLRQSAVHVEEFLLAKATWKELDGLSALSQAPQEETADRGMGSVIPFAAVTTASGAPSAAISHSQTRSTTMPSPHAVSRIRSRRISWAAGIAAGVVGAVLVAWWSLSAFQPATEVHVTKVGDQKSVALLDGSVLHLNTNSRAEVEFSDSTRDVQLLEGEALFVVAHDAARPFRVHSGDVVIQAVGTQFNVYRTGETTKVAVVEGVVQLATHAGDSTSADVVRLGADEEVRVVGGAIARVSTPNVDRAVAWRARKLVFQGDRADDIVREFNRYSVTRLRIEGDALRGRKVSGVFDADDPSPLLQFLSRDPAVEIVRSDEEVLIRLRH